jgi:YfiH family protein
LLRREVDGLLTYHFESLAVEGLVHAVFTRLGGVSHPPFATLNVGRSVGDDQTAVTQNHARIYAYLGLAAGQVVSPHQVHGNRVAVATAADAGREIPNTDGLVTNVTGLALLLRFADCQPILLYDPVHHALGLIHAGWRSVAQGIAHRAVETMQEAFDTDPEQLLAGLGPAIGPSCYTVGDNVASAMGYALPDWNRVMSLRDDRWYLDLPGANAQQLDVAGVRSVEQAHLCTACHSDEFYSHRAEGGRTGRFAVVAYLAMRAEQGGHDMAEGHPGEPGGIGPDEPDSLHPPGFPGFQEMLGDTQ